MLHNVVLSQKKELEEQLAQRYVSRDLTTGDISGDKLVRVIIGPRRSGKSLFALHLLHRTGPFGYLNTVNKEVFRSRSFTRLTGGNIWATLFTRFCIKIS